MTCLDEDGNPLPGEPKDAGDYTVILAFTVEKATITLKADDK